MLIYTPPLKVGATKFIPTAITKADICLNFFLDIFHRQGRVVVEDISDICFNILYSLSFLIADTSFPGARGRGGSIVPICAIVGSICLNLVIF